MTSQDRVSEELEVVPCEEVGPHHHDSAVEGVDKKMSQLLRTRLSHLKKTFFKPQQKLTDRDTSGKKGRSPLGAVKTSFLNKQNQIQTRIKETAKEIGSSLTPREIGTSLAPRRSNLNGVKMNMGDNPYGDDFWGDESEDFENELSDSYIN